MKALQKLKIIELNSPTVKDILLFNNSLGKNVIIRTPAALNELPEYESLIENISEVLADLLRPFFGKKLLICGIGNSTIAFDSLGPKVLSNLPLHFFALSDLLKVRRFKDVFGFSPGVLLKNNISTESLIASIIKAVNADCVLAIDCCSTNNPSKIFREFQFSTAGDIAFGFNKNFGLDNLEIPSIALAVPAVFHSSAIKEPTEKKELFTSGNIRELVDLAGTILAAAIMRVCWPDLLVKECVYFSKIESDPLPAERWVPEEISTKDLEESSYGNT